MWEEVDFFAGERKGGKVDETVPGRRSAWAGGRAFVVARNVFVGGMAYRKPLPDAHRQRSSDPGFRISETVKARDPHHSTKSSLASSSKTC
jgi:hypothetical protein